MAQVMIDVAGTELSADDRALLAHPDVNGLILFTRNFQSPEQLQSLCHEARQVAQKPLLIAVDHEGGRVQRFRDGFSDSTDGIDSATVYRSGRAGAGGARAGLANGNGSSGGGH